jgi:non-heme Fe2+,alpha-ketoglutarate-dependent halogenase
MSITAPAHLSPAEVARYRQAGYHFPVRVMSTAQAGGYMAKLAAHEAKHGPFKSAMRHKAHLYLTWLDDIVRLPSVLDAVGDILGPDILVYSSSFFIKEPHDPAFVSWHQDAHYWGLNSGDVVTAWIALIDSDTENGAMRVVPETHLIDLPHVDTFAENNMLSRGQEIAVDLGGRGWVELGLKAGEMSLHHVGLAHGSEPNRSTLVRGTDRFGNFEHEPSPSADMAPEALAYHRFAMDRLSGNVMKGSGKTMDERL